MRKICTSNSLEVVFHFASQQVYQRQMSVPDQEMCIHFQWRFHGFQDNLYVGPVLLCLFAIAGKQKFEQFIPILMGRDVFSRAKAGNTFYNITEVEKNGMRILLGNGDEDVRNLSENLHFDGAPSGFPDNADFQKLKIFCLVRKEFLQVSV